MRHASGLPKQGPSLGRNYSPHKKPNNRVWSQRKARYYCHRRDKQRGEWLEMQFMARAACQGFIASKPWGESGAYDFALNDQEHFCRVQVNLPWPSTSTDTTSQGRARQSEHGTASLHPDQIDYFASTSSPNTLGTSSRCAACGEFGSQCS